MIKVPTPFVDRPVDVIATARGYDGISMREIGERFTMPASSLRHGPTWFEAELV